MDRRRARARVSHQVLAARGARHTKARILLDLGSRGDELGQVLEQIMSLEIYYDARDTARERDFVDDAPAGLIDAEIVARYNAFCPKIDGIPTEIPSL